ncbi:Glycerol-3-phosphate dehydrogenase [NAD(P)+] [Desulfurella amilsii]|uniref:Glycerol-3-phosphate dehydrogenase [NAD(P)+] n=1 Tax=Desulfurella amilsii TaxID=1562698 RepID=A0A1X4XY10_9BACT|nr:NAD(P)H-dependent glycerol-3-phosphate dehydrogenase [Desulfurella amilsii]OSS42419.1 Glycerol-3-phosphate dehydrogenase [NAD(P)+] [Desulfurella amilsii]
MYEICVYGAGSWGTAVANLLAKKKFNVCLCARDEKLVLRLRETHHNNKYLKDIHLSQNLVFDTPKNAQMGIFAVPVKYLRDFIEHFSIKVDAALSLSKGIEDETFLPPSGILFQTLGITKEQFAVLSGPNFALEVALELPTASVVASSNRNLAKKLQNMFNTHYFRVYTSSDYIGVEYLGALKNILAIACGISDGLNLGQNARAALITRGLAEILRTYKYFGGKSKTMLSLAGIGDIVLTATGNLSRNRILGLKLAQGLSIDEILNQLNGVPEGLNTVMAVFRLSQKYSIETPIINEVYNIIVNKKDPFESISILMNRPLKSE